MLKQDKHNPNIAIFISLIGCGAGQLYNQQLFKGVLFVLVGTYFNTNASLNQALVYSFLGQIELAKETLDYEWGLNYMSAFYFSIWDAYYNAFIRTYKHPPHSLMVIPYVTAVMFGDIAIFYDNYLGIGPIFSGIVGSLFGIGVGNMIKHFITKIHKKK